jgi:TolB-like protein
MRNLLNELKERRFWRVLVAYPSLAFVLLQVVEFFINNYELDARYLTASMIAAAVLLPAAIVWNWRHGEAGEQAFSTPEVLTYVANFAIASVAVAWYWSVTPPQFRDQLSTVAARTIAVMPFEVSSGNDDLQYLGDGIAESLINWLARAPDISVVAKTASFRERGNDAGHEKLASALHADALLLGELEANDEYVSVSAALIDVRSMSQLWGERFQRPLGEALFLEREIVAALTNSLSLSVSESDNSVSASGGTNNPEAYEAYQRGHYLIQSTDATRINLGLDELRKAISLDPKFGLPYADIADALSQLVFYGGYGDPMLLGEARSAAYSAVAQAPALPEAHIAMATMHQYITFDWEAAEAAYEAAIALHPQSPAPYHRYADFLWTTLRLERSREMAKRALEADPLDGSSMHAEGITYLFSGEFDKAATAFGQWVRYHPESSWAFTKYSVALALNGECDEARQQADTVAGLRGGRTPILMDSWLAWSYSVCGFDDRYAAIKERFEGVLAEDPDSANPGFVYYYLIEGDTRNLNRIIEKLIAQKSPVAMFLPIFTLDYMGWADTDVPDDEEELRELLAGLDFPPNDVAL